MRLAGPANIAQMVSSAALFDRQLETLFGNSNQFQTILANLPDRNGRGCVAYKSVECDSHIYGKNVAFLQVVTRRKAVHNLLVDRRTNRKRKSVVALKGRIFARAADQC